MILPNFIQEPDLYESEKNNRSEIISFIVRLILFLVAISIAIVLIIFTLIVALSGHYTLNPANLNTTATVVTARTIINSTANSSKI